MVHCLREATQQLQARGDLKRGAHVGFIVEQSFLFGELEQRVIDSPRALALHVEGEGEERFQGHRHLLSRPEHGRAQLAAEHFRYWSSADEIWCLDNHTWNYWRYNINQEKQVETATQRNWRKPRAPFGKNSGNLAYHTKLHKLWKDKDNFRHNLMLIECCHSIAPMG